MADRVKLLTQKRTSLKSQITILANLVDKNKLDNTTLKLRVARLNELYRAYEDFNDELAVLDPSDGHQTEFENIQERFYALVGKIESILDTTDTSRATASVSDNGNRGSEVATVDRKSVV